MKIMICQTFYNRLIGFMFKIKKINYGLCFPKCNSIHTFFMFQTIDIIMTNKNNKILYLFPNLKPNRIIMPKKNVYYTYELPIDSIKKLKLNDFFDIKQYTKKQ